jgi:nitrate reductase gamma subunit
MFPIAIPSQLAEIARTVMMLQIVGGIVLLLLVSGGIALWFRRRRRKRLRDSKITHTKVSE